LRAYNDCWHDPLSREHVTDPTARRLSRATGCLWVAAP
jgi:hypothetical protein